MRLITRKRLAGLVLVGAFTIGTASTAGAWGPEAKCNAGRGNLSETTPATDCDPGRSGLVNQGGD